MRRPSASSSPFQRRTGPLVSAVALILLVSAGGCRKKAIVTPPSAPATETVDEVPQAPPPVLQVHLEPETFNPEQGTWLIWDSTGAQTVTIAPGIGEVLPAGRIQLFPQQDSVYTLSASGAGGVTTLDVRAVLSTRATVDAGQTSGVPIPEQFKLYFTPVYFGPFSTRLEASAKDDLDRALAWLQSPANTQLRLLVQGHCDPRGSDEYGLALGDRRASVVRAYLLNGGLDESRVEAVSMGAEIDLAESDTPEQHALNRRVEFLLLEGTP